MLKLTMDNYLEYRVVSGPNSPSLQLLSSEDSKDDFYDQGTDINFTRIVGIKTYNHESDFVKDIVRYFVEKFPAEEIKVVISGEDDNTNSDEEVEGYEKFYWGAVVLITDENTEESEPYNPGDDYNFSRFYEVRYSGYINALEDAINSGYRSFLILPYF